MGRMKDKMIDKMNEENEMIGKKKIEKLKKEEAGMDLETYEQKISEIEQELDRLARKHERLLILLIKTILVSNLILRTGSRNKERRRTTGRVDVKQL